MVGRRRIAGTALVTGPDGPATRAIVGALGRRGYEVTRREDPATLPARAADSFALVILVDVGWDAQPSFAHVKQYARLLSRGGGALLVVTHDDSVEDLAALVATGARDFLVWPRDRAALKARILALESTQRAMAAAQDARDQMDALLRAHPDTHLIVETDGVVTDVARGTSAEGGEGVVGWIGRRVDEIFSVPGGHELLGAVRRASESGEIVSLGGPVTVRGESWKARLSPLVHGRVLVILRHDEDGDEPRRALALGTELPRRVTPEVLALALAPSLTPAAPAVDDAPAAPDDEPPARPPTRAR
jgi:DNA-binding NarL/FixJ family response regulator